MSLFQLRHWGTVLGACVYSTKHYTPWLEHWRFDPDDQPTAEWILSEVQRIRAETSYRSKGKGHPDTEAIRKRFANEIARALQASSENSALAAARCLASMDMRDPATFRLFSAMLQQASRPALLWGRTHLQPKVILHITCKPRIDRAAASALSFTALEQDGVSQLLVVGSGRVDSFQIDESLGILSVPAPDTYEHLPAKVVAAMSFLGLCPQVEVVLKVDDDHRLKSGRALSRLMSRAKGVRPVQWGELLDSGALGLQARTWHFGKTQDPQLSGRPHSFASPSRWANGAAGYVLNRQALRLMFWSYVYFEDQIRTGLYEDAVISDLIERQGGRLVGASMAGALSTVEDY